jgi:hypothetical protein
MNSSIVWVPPVSKKTLACSGPRSDVSRLSAKPASNSFRALFADALALVCVRTRSLRLLTSLAGLIFVTLLADVVAITCFRKRSLRLLSSSAGRVFADLVVLVCLRVLLFSPSLRLFGLFQGVPAFR